MHSQLLVLTKAKDYCGGINQAQN